jgi:hypothetical protein
MANKIALRNIEDEQTLSRAKAKQLSKAISFLWNLED